MTSRVRLVGYGLLLLSSIAAAHCGGSTSNGSTGTGADGGPVPGVPPGPPPSNLPAPTNHRPDPVACDATRPAGLRTDAGAPDSGIVAQCSSDADCTAGTNGRCSLPARGGGDVCTYDECATAAQCANAKVCECGTSVGTFGADGTPMRTGNRCVPGNCGVDSDCGPNNFCSPTYNTTCGPYSGIVAYQCHTPADECTNDDQCSDGGSVGYCAFEPASGKWVCGHGFCAG